MSLFPECWHCFHGHLNLIYSTNLHLFYLLGSVFKVDSFMIIQQFYVEQLLQFTTLRFVWYSYWCWCCDVLLFSYSCVFQSTASSSASFSDQLRKASRISSCRFFSCDSSCSVCILFIASFGGLSLPSAVCNITSRILLFVVFLFCANPCFISTTLHTYLLGKRFPTK